MRILLETPDILAVEKPTGLSTHAPERGGDGLIERLTAARDEHLGVHHRLDAATSGVIVFSRTREGARMLARAFEERTARKRYLAITRGHLDDERGTLEHHLARRGERRVPTQRGGDRAVTRYRTLRRLGPWSLLELRPITGRTHQIRAQLAAAGAPVVGDTLYGGGRGPGRMLLHAAELGVEDWSVESPPPALLEPETASEQALLIACVQHALDSDAPPDASDAYRLFSGPTAGVPGLRVDRFGPAAVLRCYDPAWTLEALTTLGEHLCASGLVSGALFKEHPAPGQRGSARPDAVLAGVIASRQFTVTELGVRYEVDLDDGLGCGLYLDQAENRGWLRDLDLSGEVMNLFAYTCGFSVAAAVGGARRVTSVDLSRKALAWGRRNFEVNGLDPSAHRFFSDDVFEALGRARRREERYEVIVIDPPAFARGPRGTFSVERDYARLVEGAARITAEGGLLLLCNNHAGVSMRTFGEAIEAGLGLASRPPLEAPERLALDGADAPVDVLGTALKTVRVRLGAEA